MLVSAIRIGTAVAAGSILPVAASVATDTAAACVSAKPATPVAIASPRSPSQTRIAADASSTTAIINPSSSDALTLNTTLPCTGSVALRCRPFHVHNAPYAAAVTPPQASGTASTRNVARSVTASTAAICTKVATVESTAAATADRRSAGRLRACEPITPMVATLDTKPESNPASGRPTRLPASRSSAWAAAPIDMMRITISHSARGLIAPNGPSCRSGTRGSTSSVAAANTSRLFSSSAVSTPRTK